MISSFIEFQILTFYYFIKLAVSNLFRFSGSVRSHSAAFLLLRNFRLVPRSAIDGKGSTAYAPAMNLCRGTANRNAHLMGPHGFFHSFCCHLLVTPRTERDED